MGLELLPVLGISLGLTIVLELAFAFAVGKRDRKNLLLVCLVNVLTNPAVVLVYYITVNGTAFDPLLVKIALETIAVLAEAYYYKTYGSGFRHPFWFSVCANLFSFGLGAILNALL